MLAKLCGHILFWILNAIYIALPALVALWIVYSQRLGGSAFRAALTGAGICVVDDFGQPHPATPSEFQTLFIAEVGSLLCFAVGLILTVLLDPIDSHSSK